MYYTSYIKVIVNNKNKDMSILVFNNKIYIILFCIIFIFTGQPIEISVKANCLYDKCIL